MRKFFSFFRAIFNFSAFLFPLALVFYLILFLLENLFPGFVTNIFDLNYFLIPVLFFGFLAAFSPLRQGSEEQAKQEVEKATRWDILLVAGLSILSFLILIYKTGDLGLEGFVISIGSAILVCLVSLFLLFSKEEEEEEIIEVSEREFNIPRFSREKHNYKKLLISPIGFSLTGLLIVIIIGGLVFSLFQGKKAEEKKIVDIKKEVGRIVQLPRPEIPDNKLLEKTPVLIQNGSGITGKAASIAAFLKDFKFGNIKTGDADSSSYKKASLKFNKEDLKVASYIMFLLIDNGEYYVVNMLPATSASQSGIILILGQ